MTPAGPRVPRRTYRLTETRELTLEQWVGGRVKALRLQRGWRQIELCRIAGIGTVPHESAVSRIEHGHHDLKVSTLQKLADAFGVTPRDLLP